MEKLLLSPEKVLSCKKKLYRLKQPKKRNLVVITTGFQKLIKMQQNLLIMKHKILVRYLKIIP